MNSPELKQLQQQQANKYFQLYSNFPALPADPEPPNAIASPGSEKNDSAVIVPPRLSSTEKIRKFPPQKSNSAPAAPSPILSAKPLQPPAFPLPPSPVIPDPVTATSPTDANSRKINENSDSKVPVLNEKKSAVNMKRSKSDRSRRTYKPLAPAVSPNVPSIPAPSPNPPVTAPVYSDDMDPLEFMDMLNDYLHNKPSSLKPKHQRSRSAGSLRGVKADNIRASSYSNTSASPTLTNASLPSSARSSYRQQSPPDFVHLQHPQLVQQQQIPAVRKTQGFSENVLNLLQSLPDPNQQEHSQQQPPRPHTPTTAIPPSIFNDEGSRITPPFRSNSPHPSVQSLEANPTKTFIYENPQQHLQIQAKKRAQQLQNLSDFVKFPPTESPNSPKSSEISAKKEILEKKKEIDQKSKQAAALALSFR